MSWVGAAIAGSAVVGYVASSNATNAQTRAAQAANDTQYSMYQQQREDQRKWRETGERALDTINLGMENGDYLKDFTKNDFEEDPGYQFRLDQGQKAIEKSAAARGSLNSGATLKSLTRYAQGVASDEYQNAYNRFNSDRDRRFNRLASVAGLGQTANGQVANAGTNYANNVSNNQMAVGNAQAAQAIATGNNINNTASTGMNTWMQYQMMNRFAPQSSGTAK